MLEIFYDIFTNLDPTEGIYSDSSVMSPGTCGSPGNLHVKK